MLLKSLEISGFKSFPKKSKFEFSSSISAIVGPNGSGKSNVAEAFRFVLGEQSIKSMRGKKGEDLIWNGGKDEPRSNRAGVKVIFDNSKKFLDVDFSEVILERVVHRDGVNEYLINGSSVRLKDIVELLAGAHVGASGHHIISQGEADRILNANIKERREMIEDALGLKIYQYKRGESEKKLLKTEENIRQVEALRKEIAPHLKFLKKQVEKLETAKNQKDELKTLAKEYLALEHIYIENLKKDIQSKKKPLEQKKERLEKELSEARKVIEKSKQRDEKSDEIISLESQMQSRRKERDSLLSELGRLQGEISSEKRLLEKHREIESKNDTAMVALNEVEDFSREVQGYISEVETSDNITEIKSLFVKIGDLVKDLINRAKKSAGGVFLGDSEETIKALTSELRKKENMLEEVSLQHTNLEKTYSVLRKQIEKEKDTNREAEKALFRIQSEESAMLSEMNLISSEENRLGVLEEDFKRELEECAILAGREVADYKNFEVGNSDDDRSKQEERRRVIERVKIRLEDSGITGSDDVMKEFSETNERDEFLARELNDLEKSAESLKGLIEELGIKIDEEFKGGIGKINTEFQKFFELMFGGGNAELKVIKESRKTKRSTDLELAIGEEESILEDEEGKEGIEIEVSLPRKKIKGLMMLSGGERALTSIALIFAMSQVNPPPFIILDETDAALDEANSRKYGDMIENLSKHSQLILITHNRETMSRAGIIYGVTMGESGASKVLSIQFDEAVAVAK